MRIIFFGTPSFVIPVLEKIIQHYEVVAVVTAPDKKVGRKQILTPSPVKDFALQHNIKVFTSEKLSEIQSELSTLNPQLFVVAAYGKIIPQSILDLPDHGAINIHPSALPQYRGPSPLTTALLNGDKKSAISFMLMDAEMDHGPVLQTIPFEISANVTFETLVDEVFKKSAQVLPQVIDDYVAGKIKSTPQNDDEATYTKMVTRQDGFIDLKNPPDKEQIDRMIRAYFPWPNVWGTLKIKEKDVRIKFLPPSACHPEQSKESHPSGDSSAKPQNDNALCIQLEGGNPMPVKDFLNGYPDMKEMIETIIK